MAIGNNGHKLNIDFFFSFIFDAILLIFAGEFFNKQKTIQNFPRIKRWRTDVHLSNKYMSDSSTSE